MPQRWCFVAQTYVEQPIIALFISVDARFNSVEESNN
jgi:hypothetical protein